MFNLQEQRGCSQMERSVCIGRGHREGQIDEMHMCEGQEANTDKDIQDRG